MDMCGSALMEAERAVGAARWPRTADDLARRIEYSLERACFRPRGRPLSTTGGSP
jgi:hypothetical protein